MTVMDMHYDYKQKLNRMDSQKYRGLLVPEIDKKLNEAQEIFVKMIAEPRSVGSAGFEIGRRTIDDIRTIVIDAKPDDYIVAEEWDDVSYIVDLSKCDNYWFFLKPHIVADKGGCKNVLLYDSKEVQHDDVTGFSKFSSSSFEWRSAMYRFNKEGIRVFTDGTFVISKVGVDYIKRPRPIYNATSWMGGKYKGTDGVLYEGRQDSELPEGTHSEIVDIAVLITAGDLNLPSYNLKMNKVKIVNN